MNVQEINEKCPILSLAFIFHTKMKQMHHSVITEHLNIPVIPLAASASLLGWDFLFPDSLMA